MTWIVWVHVPALVLFLALQGFGVWGSIGPVLPVMAAGAAATLTRASRRARSLAVVFGLLTASAVLVYGWHGQIEAHFHYFVIIGVLALYEDWLPFGLAIVYVAVEHGAGGLISAHAVYDHGGNPWEWAGIHAGFVVAAAAAAVTTWRLNEDTRARMQQAQRDARERAHAATHDSLTGVANRMLFMERLADAVARLQSRPGQLAVLFVDLDRFKHVNDSLGHSVGDAVLREAAARLSRSVRVGDTLARLGGDEFTILCENAGEQDAARVAGRVVRGLAEPFEYAGRALDLGASVGIRTTDSAEASAKELLREADIALYEAKRRGRGRLEIFDAHTRQRHGEHVKTEPALRSAVRDGQLRLHYQPEIVLETGRITAIEALVRWERPGHGIVLPSEFIPLAERSGLIIDLGAWVLEEACAQLGRWRREGVVDEQVRMAVNVSGAQLSDPGLPPAVARALTAAGLQPDALCLEITESALVEDLGAALPNLEEIKQMGAAIALDDFGVGFSSLSRIRDLPRIDALKIDRSFVSGLAYSSADSAVVGAVLSLAAHLELTVIAEGIEDVEQLVALKERGCRLGQGYFFARPQPAQELTGVLRAGTIMPQSDADVLDYARA